MNKIKSLLACAVLIFSSASFAAPITIQYEGSGSGTLGGVAFANLAFTITAFADNDFVFTPDFSGNAFSLIHNSAFVELEGLGTYEFQVQTSSFINHDFGVAGFSRHGDFGFDLYNLTLSNLVNEDFTQEFEETTSLARLGSWQIEDIPTSGGVLFFDPLTSDGTFRVIDGQVPVPAGIWLLGSALIGLTLKRKSSNQPR